MSDYYGGSGSDNYTTAVPQAQDQPDSTREVLTSNFWAMGGTALSEALAAAGMQGNDYSQFKYQGPTTPPWVDPAQVPPGTPRSAFYDMGTPDLEDDRVYMGKNTDPSVPSHMGNPRLEGTEAESTPRVEGQPDSISVAAALNQPYMWSEDHTSKVMERMRKAGLPVKSFEDMLGAWQMLVTRASRAFTLSKGKRQVTPWDILSTVKKENVEAGVLDKDGNIVQTQVQKSVNEISDGDAWASLKSQMSQLIGRDPSDQEVRDYASKLNAIAARNPSVTKTTTTTDAETGDSSTTSHTTGGFDEADQAQEMYDDITGTDEYAQYQSATTYMNALFGALGETAGGMA